MARLRNTRTGETYDVSDVDAVQAARENPDLEVMGDVAVSPQTRFAAGAVTRDPNAEAASDADVAAFFRARDAEAAHDTAGSRVRATLGGTADALSLGFLSPWREDQEFHPGYATGGKVAGIAATLLAPGVGEENLARAGLEGAEGLADAAGVTRAAREAESVGEIARGSRLTRAIGSAAERTPLGGVNRLARAAGELVPEGGALSRITRTGIEGAAAGGAIGLGTELSRQLLESDVPFSGESLLGATLGGAVAGGLIGGAGGAVSEGLSAATPAVRRLLGRGASRSEGMSQAEFASRAGARAPTPYSEAADLTPGGRPPLAPMLDPRNATLLDGVTSRMGDLESLGRTLESLSEAPALARQAGLTPQYIREARGTVETELAGLRSLSRSEDAPVARLAENAHANDLVGARLSEVTERVPARWSDPELRAQVVNARDRALDELAAKRARGLPVSQAEEDAVRYSAQLSVGRAPAEAEDMRGSLLANAARSLVSRLPGGRLLASGLGAAGGVGIAEHLIAHGVGGLVGHAALPVAGALVGGRIVQAAFRDPHVGGIIAANAASVLNSTALLRGGDRPSSTDPRRALRDLADRARAVTPQQAGAALAASLSGVAGSSPAALAAAGQAATNRHAALLDLLDRVDPQATSPGQHMLGRPLPSAQAARQVSDFVRVAASPTNFLVAALQGRLTASMMAQAERLWPATVGRVRAELASRLSSGGGERLAPDQRRTVEVLMGPQGLGGPPRSAAYSDAMRASAARTHAPTPSGGPHPGATRVTPPEPTPAQRAANPGASR